MIDQITDNSSKIYWEMDVNLLKGFLEVAMVFYGMFRMARSTRKNKIQKMGKERLRAMGFCGELVACVL